MGRPRKHPRRWYRCIQSFGGFDATGTPNDCHAGEVLPENDPRVKGSPQWFEALDKDYPGPKEETVGEAR